jgi:hypothetical protein
MFRLLPVNSSTARLLDFSTFLNLTGANWSEQRRRIISFPQKKASGQPQDKILAYQGSFVKRQKVRGAENSQARCGGWQTAQQIG